MRPQVFLGFDFGTRQIGVAVGGTVSGAAQGLDTIAVHNNRPDWPRIGQLIEAWRPDALVVGLPLNMDGSPNELTHLARKFGNRLRARYNLPVHMVDERLTSVAARETLAQTAVRPSRRKQATDRLAAGYIVQAFLDELAAHGHGR